MHYLDALDNNVMSHESLKRLHADDLSSKTRREYTKAKREAGKARTRYDVSLADLNEREARRLALRITQLLGHVAIRQRDAMECMNCSACGIAGSTLTGEIFSTKCGAK